MPELPEVETTRLGIRPHLLGQQLQAYDLRNGRLRYPLDEADLAPLLGLTLLDIRRRSKYLIFDFGKLQLYVHLGMSGSLRLESAAAPLRTHDHVVLQWQNSWQLRYHDPRRFGFWKLAEQGHMPDFLQHLGPEPLGDSLSVFDFFAAMQGRNQPIKSWIMDGKRLVGVGNIYANESLFLAKIHPATPVKYLEFSQVERLLQVIQEVLRKAIAQGGTTLQDFVQPDGNLGYFAQELCIYNRQGQNCVLCRSPIEKIILAQRSTYFCPQCQPLEICS